MKQILVNSVSLNSTGHKYEGIRAMYNIRTDPELGIRRAAIRRIPCACKPCIDQLKIPWNYDVDEFHQPRYDQNVQCKNWNRFLGTNDWQVVVIDYNQAIGARMIFVRCHTMSLLTMLIL